MSGRNSYNWDWGMVLRLCPDYAQYLTDKDGNEVDMNKICPWSPDDNSEFEPGDTDTAFVEELIAHIDNEQPLADNAVLPADEFMPHGGKYNNMTDEEKAIINAMHTRTAQKQSPNVIHNDRTIPIRADYDDTEYILKPQYRNYKTAIMPTVPLLAPPKIVLGGGSEVWYGARTVYQVNARTSRNPVIVELWQNKIYYNHAKGIVGLVKHSYWFNRLTNAVSEKKKHTKMTIYNTRTHKLYYVSYQKPTAGSTRYKRQLHQMSLNIDGFSAAIGGYRASLSDKLIIAILESAFKVVPNMYLPEPVYYTNRKNPEDFSNKHPNPVINTILHANNSHKAAFCASLQARVGKRLEWLSNEKLLQNISEYVKCTGFTDLIYGREYTKQIKQSDKTLAAYHKSNESLKRKTYYKVIPNLKKDPGQKSLMKSLFGPFYKKLYGKLMSYNEMDAPYSNEVIKLIFQLIQIENMDMVHKRLYHKIVHDCDNFTHKNIHTYIEILTDICGVQVVGATRFNIEMPDDHITTESKNDAFNVIDLYLNLEERIGDVNWHTFRDTLSMAKDVGIRVRINKITDRNDLQELHDKLSQFQLRNLNAIQDYEGVTFKEYESPTKSYDGYEFIQLRTSAELVEEGTLMHHCVGGYSYKCVEGSSIIYSMRKEGRGYVTLELDGNAICGDIRQQYTIGDYTINNADILKLIKKWKEDLDVLHKNDTETYRDISTKTYKTLNIQNEIKKLEERLSNTDQNALMDIDGPINEATLILKRIEKLNAELSLLNDSLDIEFGGDTCQDVQEAAPAL